MSNYPLTDYQKYLLSSFKKIYQFRELGFSYRRISNFFNENKIRSTRGKSFSPSMIYQIIKKNNIRLKRREIKYKIILHDFRLELL